MNKNLYLLTGASGLLGGNILRNLIAKGENVRVFVRDPAKKYIPHEADIVTGNLLDKEALHKFFEAPEDTDIIVIHAAGIVTMNPKPDKEVHMVNVDGTTNIIEKCLERKVKKLVYISSTNAIPERPKGEQIREVSFHDVEKVIGYYSKTKAEATELVLKAVREQNLDASIICPSGIFGPNDYGFGLITSSMKMFASGKLRIAIGGSFSSVDVRDLAKGVITCAEKGRKGETYIMADAGHTFKELLDTTCQVAGAKKPLLTIPLWLLRPFTWVGVLHGKLNKQPPWFSKYTIYNLERNNNYSAQKAEKELGFSCRSFHETIKDTIEWLRREGEIN